MRLIIDAKVKTEPRTYIVSKVNRLSPNGLVRVTLAEKLFNSQTDYIELDEDGNVAAMWADYWKNGNIPPSSTDELPINTYSEITYSGTRPEIKINGSYKKFTVSFYKNDLQIAFQHGDWNFMIDDKDASNIIETSTEGLDENQIKIKFKGNDTYIGKVLTVSYNSFTGIKSNVKISIVGL